MSENTQKPAQSQPAAKSTLGEWVIEIVAPNNATVKFPPVNEFLRGRWNNHEMPLGLRSERGLMHMPEIPGLHVRIDPAGATGEVIDPLASDPELMATISRVYKTLDRRERGPRKATKQTKLPPERIATWIFWMIRLVTSGKARTVTGREPTLADLQRAYPSVKVQKVWSASKHELPEQEFQAIEDLAIAA